ncbi:hypothetical protein VP01_26g6 [Puccinia sorghi]|uniref:Uncharacterized protein n=1 Tax=Puccinia sorghi TaxID=27349 RepID=A0A0L6V3S3_9BASI|nr:hypothetical protein VP01_26g6 [Puccinia sorghi]
MSPSLEFLKSFYLKLGAGYATPINWISDPQKSRPISRTPSDCAYLPCCYLHFCNSRYLSYLVRILHHVPLHLYNIYANRNKSYERFYTRIFVEKDPRNKISKFCHQKAYHTLNQNFHFNLINVKYDSFEQFGGFLTASLVSMVIVITLAPMWTTPCQQQFRTSGQLDWNFHCKNLGALRFKNEIYLFLFKTVVSHRGNITIPDIPQEVALVVNSQVLVFIRTTLLIMSNFLFFCPGPDQMFCQVFSYSFIFCHFILFLYANFYILSLHIINRHLKLSVNYHKITTLMKSFQCLFALKISPMSASEPSLKIYKLILPLGWILRLSTNSLNILYLFYFNWKYLPSSSTLPIVFPESSRTFIHLVGLHLPHKCTHLFLKKFPVCLSRKNPMGNLDFPSCKRLRRSFQDLNTEYISPDIFTFTGNIFHLPSQKTFINTHSTTQAP